MNKEFKFNIKTLNADGSTWTDQNGLETTGIAAGEYINVRFASNVTTKAVKLEGASATGTFYDITEVEVYNYGYTDQKLWEVKASIKEAFVGVETPITITPRDKNGFDIKLSDFAANSIYPDIYDAATFNSDYTKVTLNQIGTIVIKFYYDADSGLKNLVLTGIANGIIADDCGYATYGGRGHNLKFGNDVKVYIVTGITNTEVTLKEIVSKEVPKYQGVIIKGTKGNHKAEVIKSTAEDYTDNKLQVSNGNNIQNVYVLYNGTKGVGFYKLASGKSLEKGKCYLNPSDVPASSPAKLSIGIDGEGTTGISDINAAESAPKAAYNLNGSRVSDSYKGIVIINGKKVIRK